MSSTEQAPEPTMDEILASIRKIISDDEAGGEAQPEGAEAESAAAEPAAATGGGLVDDLANALNEVQDAEAKSAEQPPEDILDLTQIISDQPAEDASPETAAAPVDAAMPEVAAMPEAAVAPEAAVVEEAPAEPEASAEPATPAASDTQADESDITALLAKAGVQDMADEAEAAPQEAIAPTGEELNAAIEQDDTVLGDPAPAGEASISDALAALDNPAAETAPADTVPDEAAQAQDAAFDADLVTSGEPAAQALDEPGEASASEMTEQSPEIPAPAAESFSEIEANTEFDAQMPEDSAEEAQADVALSEPEAPVIDEPVEAAAALAGALEGIAQLEEAPAGLEDEASEEAEGSVEADSLLEAEAPAEAEATAEAEETVAEEAETASESDVTAASGEVRTLEDSVKDLLRPMLREWLDDNMERIVQDEVASANLKSGDG